MQLLSGNTNIDFMSKGKLCLSLSIAVLLLCIGSLVVRGMNFGLDFTGGTVIEASYSAPVEIPQIRGALEKAGFADSQTQHFGTSSDVLIRIAPRSELNSAQISDQVLAALKDTGQVEMRRVEFVGPQVGEELVAEGSLAMLVAMLGILFYVMFRFEWRLALGTIAATFHDVVFTIGIFSVFQIEFDLTVLAAVLAVIGYSVNDTVVVLDRIRENFRRMRKETTYEVMNASINQTLSRTIMTSMSTLLAVIVLYFFGGQTTRNFSLAMIFGILVGTYSSIYIASASAWLLGLSREDLLPKAKEALDERP